MFNLDLEKAEKPEIKSPTFTGSIEKARELKRKNLLCFIDYAKVFVWITTNFGKLLKIWELQISLTFSSETWMQTKKQELELDMEQQTGCKLGKEYIKTVYCRPAYLT